MSREAMTWLTNEVRAMVRGAEGDPNVVMTVLSRVLRTNPARLFGVWEELATLGSEERHRVPQTVAWAHGLVNDLLHEMLPGDEEHWRRLKPVALGIVDLLATEIQNYYREQAEGHR